MKYKLGKWKQHVLLQQNLETARFLPESNIYNLENLSNMLNRFDHVYVKHDSLGQGRGIFKVRKNKDGDYRFDGFSIHGIRKNMCVSTIDEFHPILHPYAKFGRLSGNYIIQEGIHSLTKSEQPFSIRVHVQILKGKWLVGGIYAKIAYNDHTGNGIVNSHRGAEVLAIDDLLTHHLNMDNTESSKIKHSLEKISISAAEIVFQQVPQREYGIDFGINQIGQPILFEVNTTPGIGNFAKVENKVLWRNIVDIRKKQKEKKDL